MQSSQDCLVAETSSGKHPYSEVWSNGIIRRTFYTDVVEDELVWHRDRKNREVRIVESEGWKLQYDNELPIDLEKGKTYFIEAMRYHRVIRGNGNLVLEIRED